MRHFNVPPFFCFIISLFPKKINRFSIVYEYPLIERNNIEQKNFFEVFMEKTVKTKNFIFDFLKSALIAIVVSAILTLVLALIVTYVPVSDKVVTIINQVIKIVSVLVGCFIGISEKKFGLLKGLLAGIVYSLGTILIFAIINRDFSFSWGAIIDVGVSALIGLIVGVIKVNFGKNK